MTFFIDFFLRKVVEMEVEADVKRTKLGELGRHKILEHGQGYTNL